MLRLIPFWPRRHSYRLTAWRKWAGHAVPLFCCCHCGAEISLDRRQIRSLPWSMARCRTGRQLSLREFMRAGLGGGLDCYDPSGVKRR